jgi:hypothetical protein
MRKKNMIFDFNVIIVKKQVSNIQSKPGMAIVDKR